jgi:hypothetical protein
MPGEDTTGQSTEGTGAPAAAPAQTPEEIQALVDAQVQAAISTRIPGLQSAYEKQLAQLRAELKAKDSDPDGYEANTSSKLEAQLAEARREAEALRVARQYPEVFPVYEAILAAESPVDQLDVLQAFVQGNTPAPAQNQQAPAAPAAPAAPSAPPPVDPNRPVQDPAQQPSEFNPEGMDQNLADRIIDSVGNVWPKF